MHHETNFDDIIIISDSNDEVETIDLTVDDEICQDQVESFPVKHHKSHRVDGGDCGNNTRPTERFPAVTARHGQDGHRRSFHDKKCVLIQHTSLDFSLKKHKMNDFKKIEGVISPCSPGFEKNKSRHLKNFNVKLKKRQKLKPVRRTSQWASSDSDSDFEEKVSPPKQKYKSKPVVHRCQISPKKPTMLSVSKPVNSFPSSFYIEEMKPKLTNLHVKLNCPLDSSSESESDLPNPHSFLFGHQRVGAASPILVEPYPTFKAKTCKREVDPSCPVSPMKKSKLSQLGVVCLDDSKDRTTDQRTPVKLCSPSKGKPLWKKTTKPLLTLSDFSSSEGEFEPICVDKRIMRTPSKQNWQSGISPRKTRDLGLPRPRRKEDRSAGVPIHISVQDSKNGAENEKSLVRNGIDKSKDKVIWDFCQRQCDMIEAVVDEDFIDDAIVFIRDFATLHRGAPEEYMMYLLKDVLLANGTEEFTVLSAYDALLHIHNLHPTAATSLTLDWDLVTTIVKKLNLESTSETTKTPCLAHVLALQFIVVIVMDDFQTMKKRNTTKKSYSHSLLSADMRLGHVRNVIQWICHVVTNKLKTNPPEPQHIDKEQHEDRNIWKFLQQFTKQNTEPKPEVPEKASWKAHRSESYYSVLELLQRLLLLSFSVGMNNGALKIAEELLYLYLYIPSLEQRKICLQTLTCDPIRSKLIELLLVNLCELNTTEQQGVLSVRKIVECHFRSRPMRISEFVVVEHDLVDVVKDRGGLPSNGMQGKQGEECEELAMLLLFLLQSYVRNRTAKSLQTSSNDVQLSQSSEKSQLSQTSLLSQPAVDPWLTMDDRESLCQMGDHVEALERRLKAHCSHLTLRTRLYLAQMESMRELAC